jgi:hypothetical protein
MAFIKREKTEHTVERRENSRDLENLLEQLNDPAFSQRRMAAHDLAEFSGISGQLCRRLDIEEHPAVRAAIFSSLTKIRDAESIRGLVDLLRSEDPELRNSSIEALKQLPDQLSAEIETLLGDSDPDVRIFTINILEALPHPDVPHWLHIVILDEENVNVCSAAVDLLTELGTPNMIPDLIALKARFPDTPFVEMAVDLTVDRINSSGYVDLSTLTVADDA